MTELDRAWDQAVAAALPEHWVRSLPLPLRLTHAEAEAMRDAAREEYWNTPHCNLTTGYARWQAAIDAITALEEPTDD